MVGRYGACGIFEMEGSQRWRRPRGLEVSGHGGSGPMALEDPTQRDCGMSKNPEWDPGEQQH